MPARKVDETARRSISERRYMHRAPARAPSGRTRMTTLTLMWRRIERAFPGSHALWPSHLRVGRHQFTSAWSAELGTYLVALDLRLLDIDFPASEHTSHRFVRRDDVWRWERVELGVREGSAPDATLQATG